MNITKKYLLLQLKRVLKKYPAILTVTLLTVCALGLCAYGILSEMSGSESKQKIRVGISGDAKDSYLGMGIYALQNIDSSRFEADFEEMSESDAQKALKKGEINGYVSVPPEFIKNVASGKNTPAYYITPKSAQNFGSLLTAEITKTVSDIVTDTQTGIYAMQSVARKHDKKKTLSENTNDMNIRYINTVLTRSRIFDTATVGVSDGISPVGYYICGIIMFFLLLWGISCTPILSKNNFAIQRLVYMRGINPFAQVICEYISYLTISVMTFALFAIALTTLAPQNLLAEEFADSNPLTALIFTLRMLPVIMSVCAMQFLVSESVKGIVGTVVFQFVLAVSLGYISGFFYPDYFFPQPLRDIASLLPSGAGFAYMRKTVTFLSCRREALICLMYAVVFVMTSAFVRRKRLAGDRL